MTANLIFWRRITQPSYQSYNYLVFPRCAHDPLAACTPDQLANKLRNTGLKDTTCCRVALVVACLLVAPRVLGAPHVLSCGPGCSVCPWAAARPRAVRAASFARRVVSKPGQAPPPPTGTAAWPSGPSGALHAGGGGGFALHEALRERVTGVSDPRVVQFPPRLVTVRSRFEVV